ncbi:MAG: hypothetical protein CME70_03700 [Halobacteriovorax sp.]|nr:hypothetical protein [Halobacteriovorax sp.]|tara:strand:- start:187836 stop:188120 length:285 start_codon:yes stop_codon:yes gene_type:complete
MRSLAILAAGIFSFFYIDLRHLRKSPSVDSTDEEISFDLTDRKKKLKQKRRKYKNRKFKKRKSYGQKSLYAKNSRPRDSRYSNQKSLRRMFRND